MVNQYLPRQGRKPRITLPNHYTSRTKQNPVSSNSRPVAIAPLASITSGRAGHQQ